MPQGTVLRPLLVLLYVNDIGSNISSTIELFADDCLVNRRIKMLKEKPVYDHQQSHIIPPLAEKKPELHVFY